jgi:hypothetical protein
MIHRRRVLKLAALTTVAAGAGVVGYTFLVEPHWLEFTFRDLPIRDLPPELAGRTLMHISDVHVGPRVSDDYLIESFQRAAAYAPDIVVLTGDAISYEAAVFDKAHRIYAHFPKGTLATFAILGNHDYGHNWARPDVADRVAEILRGHGITVLRNTMHDVNGLQVAGIDDMWGTNFKPAAALAAIDARRAAIVLSHNPDTADLSLWSRYRGWILCGHTHGGQCKPPFLPPPLLPVQNRRYPSGAFDLTGERRMYISRGLGHLLPVRFNVRPEITVFTLTRG